MEQEASRAECPLDLGPLGALQREKDFSARKNFEIRARQKLDLLIHQFTIYQKILSIYNAWGTVLEAEATEISNHVWGL